VTFEGCYHGHSDALLVAAGSGVAQLSVPGSAGVTPGAVADTVRCSYNTVPELDGSIAAIIVEPVAANMNLVAPVDSFLHDLRSACDRVGALLIFDEVISGFRLGSGGASARYGVSPDLWCFGKVIGGGLPIGAFGGRAELMEHLAPTGDVYQAGTLSGNPLATAAGLCVLEHMSEPDYARLASSVEHLADGLQKAISSSGLVAITPRVGTLLGLFLSSRPVDAPRNFAEAKVLCDNGLYGAFFHAMLRRGVALAPGAYEVIFLSTAHGPADVDRIIDAAGEAALEVAAT
jgi:glutamate-1-semialdehyde 2,1-aminomutase